MFHNSGFFQVENVELRADVKFLMDQNNLLVDSLASKSISGNYQKPVENNISTTIGHRSLIPEVSNLITSVNQLTSHNFELLKMARDPGNDIGLYKKMFLYPLYPEKTICDPYKILNQH